MRRYDFMLPVAIFGDQHAVGSTYDFYGQQSSYNGLPINDITLLRAAEFHAKKVEVSFWCNSYPLMGAEAFVEDESFFLKPPETRWIPYNKMPYRKGFYKKGFWQALSERQMNLIVNNYFQMNEYIKGEIAPNLIILPLAAYIFDRVLGLNIGIYTRLLEYAWRMVDISALDSLSNEQAFTERNLLTEQAYRLIEPEIHRMIV